MLGKFLVIVLDDSVVHTELAQGETPTSAVRAVLKALRARGEIGAEPVRFSVSPLNKLLAQVPIVEAE